MPRCNGTTPCPIGKPHDANVSALSLSEREKSLVLKSLQAGKDTMLKKDGHSWTFGSRDRKRLNLQLQPSSAPPEDVFLSLLREWTRPKPKHPGAFLMREGKPAMAVFTFEEGDVSSIELFNPGMSDEQAERILRFMDSHLTDVPRIEDGAKTQ